MTQKSLSPNQRAWKRLLKNKSAVFGLIVICISVLISIFAYYIAPDHTTNCDEQILQLETHNPAYQATLLLVKRDKVIPKRNVVSRFFNRLVDGSPSVYEPIPITNYHFDGSEVVYDEYRGKTATTEEKRIALVDVLYARSVHNRNVEQTADGKLQFKDINEETISTDIASMQKEVEAKNIVKKRFLLGTDKFGRDILSRIVLGVRVSLSVGLVSVIIALLIGSVLGAVAGFFGGYVDDFVVWLINVFWSIPTFLLALGLAISIGGSKFLMIYVAVGLTMWVDMARIVRGQFMSLRKFEFVEAAKSLGFSDFRTIFRHIFPNIVGPVIVVVAAGFASAILVEAGLSFLGLGVQPPKPSWGQMLNEYRDYINSPKAYLALFPGLAIMLLVLAFNLLGNGLRDALDIRENAS